MAKSQKAQLVRRHALYDFQYHQSLGHIFAGNNQATPTNPLISSVFLLEHRGQKLNSTLGSAQGLQAAAQLFLR